VPPLSEELVSVVDVDELVVVVVVVAFADVDDAGIVVCVVFEHPGTTSTADTAANTIHRFMQRLSEKADAGEANGDAWNLLGTRLEFASVRERTVILCMTVNGN
jgi:hypothetical protein